jgi:chorismate mutase
VSEDPLIQELRRQILDLDRMIVNAMNSRIRLVEQLKRYKATRSLAFVDRGREEHMRAELTRANAGPLTPEGLEELFSTILDLTKRQVTPGEDP